METITITRKGKLKPSPGTQGIIREIAVEGEDAILFHSIVKCGVITGWHHHGKRSLYGYVIAGKGRFEFGPDGKNFAEVSSGDYFHVPAGLIHREVNTSDVAEYETVYVSTGSGPMTINVEGPEV